MVIATKDEILFVEQKHWSGSFTITSEGRFFQRRKNGGTLCTRILLRGHAERVIYYVTCMNRELIPLHLQVKSS